MQEVVGSIPSGSTNLFNDLHLDVSAEIALATSVHVRFCKLRRLMARFKFRPTTVVVCRSFPSVIVQAMPFTGCGIYHHHYGF